MNRNVTWWIFWIQRYKSDVFLTPESVLLLLALVGRFLCVRVWTMHEVPDTQALRVYPVAISLPCNPEGKDENGKRDGDCGEEPPLSTDDDRFATIVGSLGVEEYHTKQGLQLQYYSLI